MAEALTVVGVAANMVQLAEFGTKVLQRVNEFQSSRVEIPRTLKHLKDEWPILLETLKQTQGIAEKGKIEEETKDALLRLVDRCLTQLRLLDSLINKSLPQEGDSWGKRTSKALLSLRQDSKIASITAHVRTHIQSIANYHVAGVAFAAVSASSTESVSNPKSAIQRLVGLENPLDSSMVDSTPLFRDNTTSDISMGYTMSSSVWDGTSSSALTSATDLSFSSSGPTGPLLSARNSIEAIIRVQIDGGGDHQEVINIGEYEPFQAAYEAILRIRTIILSRSEINPIPYNGAMLLSQISAIGAQTHTFPFTSAFLKAVLEHKRDKIYTSVFISAGFTGTSIRSIVPVQEDLFTELEAAKVQGVDGPFIPLPRIKQILTAERIRNLLLGHYSNYDLPYQLGEISGQLSLNAPKLMAAMILACIEPLVPLFLAFWQNGFSDSSIPLSCSQLPPFCSRRDYDLICATQPQVCVAELSLSSDDVSSQTIPHQFRLPFLQRSLIGKGGFSEVFSVALHTHDYNTERQYVAIKQIQSPFKDVFLHESEVLMALRPLKHQHLINLLGSFEYRGRYHLMFPLASGSLHSLFVKYDPRCDHYLIPWALRQLAGIADGLHGFHTLPGIPAPEPARSPNLSLRSEVMRNSRHGDLKPENILWFKSSDACANIVIADIGLGKLKLSDFGQAELDQRSKFKGFTRSYSAPERDIRSRKGEFWQHPERPDIIGSPYDIWSFGATLSEVIAWIIGGSSEVEQFRIERKGPVFHGMDKGDLASPFYYYERGKLVVSPAVNRRLVTLVQRADEIFGNWGGESAGKIAELVRDCLMIDPYLRPSARVVADRLNEISGLYLESSDSPTSRPNDT